MRIWLETTWIRIVGMMLVGMLFGWVVSEASFQATPNPAQRDPHRVELVIPAGTAEKIKAGQPVPSIPETMSFVDGDLLVVKNQDSTSHQLGPVWVPPQSSGVLQVSSDTSYSVECSFTSSKVFGLDVQPALTGWIRFQGVISVGLPTGVMLALYTLAMPGKKRTSGHEE